jgi:hypothetical protein
MDFAVPQMGRSIALLWLITFLKPQTQLSEQPGSGRDNRLLGDVDTAQYDLVHAASAVRSIADQGFIIEGLSLDGGLYLTNGQSSRQLACRDIEESVRGDMSRRDRDWSGDRFDDRGYSMNGMTIDELKW